MITTPKTHSISDFMQWKQNKELDLTPRYQRKQVWDQKKKSYLIDSIFRGYPIPPIFLREIIETRTLKNIREVIDGQQRLSAILNFIEGGFTVSKLHNEEVGGIIFSELTDEQKENFLRYNVQTQTISSKNESDALDMFARYNSTGVKLNNEELRNARYFGVFKTFVQKTSLKYIEFWKQYGILTEKLIARMGESKLTSELFIFILEKKPIDGSSKIIDRYYKIYDNDEEKFKIEEIATNFDNTMKIVYELLKDDFQDKEALALNQTLFYSIFGVIFSLSGKILKNNYPKLKAVLNDILSLFDKANSDLNASTLSFVNASKKQTNSLANRTIRYKFIKKQIEAVLG